MTTIVTSQAPDANPVGKSLELTTLWTSLITVPNYEIPDETFGGLTIVVPGVAEIISPLLVCNKSASTAKVSIRIFRAETSSIFTIANLMPIGSNDILPIPLNGQFIYTGDILEVKADVNSALDVTISYTLGQAEQDDVPGA
jgi:hypothetical protein